MRHGLIALGVDWSRSPDLVDTWHPLLPQIDALQLTVEQAFAPEPDPRWSEALDRCRFRVGHGVMGSPFTVPRDALFDRWLERVQQVLVRWPVRWFIEHVGCSRAAGWQAAPMPLPASRALARTVADHLDHLADRLQVPVGLENLALAASIEDVWVQPELLDAMLQPVDGVLLLDLHNLWCQAVNHRLDPVDLLERYPLDRVKQLHVAGGTWADHPGGRLRRDTHDGPVPTEVFALLPEAIGRCANLELVVLERIGGTASAELPAELDAVRALLDAPAVPWTPREPTATWRTEPPDVQHTLYRALREDQRAAVEAIAPGWWTDARSWQAGVELLHRWGRALPG